MARVKEFDREVALEGAMELFWSKGYEATSMQALVEQMGIGRQSLYDTFGDKRQLFLSALERYGTLHIDNMLQQLNGQDASVEAIRGFFADFVRFYATSGERRGRLFVNSTLELVPRDEEFANSIKRRVAKTESALLNATTNAVDKGDVASDSDAKVLAKYLVTAIAGLGVLARAGSGRTALRKVADISLRVLE